ncbi:MAG TPA: hypothetical protein VLH85_09415 [Levilinea sp.]|nr:hypothetical protein [Levilinea sp.]
MLVLLPVVLMFLTAAALLAWQRVRPSFGYAWLATSILSLVLWVFLLFLRFYPQEPFAISGWRPIEGDASVLLFTLDGVSWPYAFALVALLVGVILTASARLELNTTPWAWAGSLAITGAGLLAIMAGNPLTLIMSWTLIDIVELGVIIRSARISRQAQQAVISFAARVGGTLMVVFALVLSRWRGELLILSEVLPEVGVFLLLAAGLRLGVVPLHLPYTHEVRMRRGLGTILRLVAPASALPVLSRLPPAVAPPDLAVFLLVFSALAALYGAAMWLSAKDELNGRPYWLITLAGMAVGSSIRGRPDAALAWGITVLLAGGTILLFTARRRSILFIPILALLGLTGLPYTPSASGWDGLIVLPFNVLDIISIAAHSLMLLGFIRHLLADRSDLGQMDRWIQVMYPFGLLVIVLSFWLLGIIGWEGSLTLGIWWGAAASVIITSGSIYLLFRYLQAVALNEDVSNWAIVAVRSIGKALSLIFRLDWVYRSFWWLYSVVQRFVQFLTIILEGDGGVLWALLLLALLATLLSPGGIQ